MAESDAQQEQLLSQEHVLADYVHRLEKHRQGRSVVRIHPSSVHPSNRKKSHLKLVAKNFEPIIRARAGQLFLLKNGDIFFFFKNEVREAVQATVEQVKYMFSDDVPAEDEAAHMVSATWFDALSDFEEIRQTVQALADAEDRRREEDKVRMDARAALRAKQKMGEPLTPDALDRAESALAGADLSSLVRRQFACSVNTSMVPEPLFSEFFISIEDLREALLPGVNLLANRWLFRHLTETLDRRMLSMLDKTDHNAITGDISFNINIRTLMSGEFIAFDDNVTANRRGTMIIEVQVEDIFADLGAYLFARDFAQSKGYRVSIDGMTPEAMQLINHRWLGADMIKLVWKDDLAHIDENMHARIRQIVDSIGSDMVVLCRCDSKEAIHSGHALGIRIFQGRYIKNLMAESEKHRKLLKLKQRIEDT